jgi:hypothetical protein
MLSQTGPFPDHVALAVAAARAVARALVPTLPGVHGESGMGMRGDRGASATMDQTRSRDGSSSSSMGDGNGSGSDQSNDAQSAERHRQRLLALAKPRSRARVMRGNFQKSYRQWRAIRHVFDCQENSWRYSDHLVHAPALTALIHSLLHFGNSMPADWDRLAFDRSLAIERRVTIPA